MKKRIIAGLCILMLVCELVGCGMVPAEDGTKSTILYESLSDAVLSMDNQYFKTKVLTYDDAGGYIIENEVTGEVFLVITSVYGVNITPIQIKE